MEPYAYEPVKPNLWLWKYAFEAGFGFDRDNPKLHLHPMGLDYSYPHLFVLLGPVAHLTFSLISNGWGLFLITLFLLGFSTHTGCPNLVSIFIWMGIFSAALLNSLYWAFIYVISPYHLWYLYTAYQAGRAWETTFFFIFFRKQTFYYAVSYRSAPYFC